MRKFIVSAALFGIAVMFLGCGKWGGENVPQSHASPAPLNVTASPGNGAVTITWDASGSATSYNVYYSTQTGVTKATGTKITGATSPSVVPNLSNGTPYYFVVTAVSAGGESAESVQVSATPSASTQALTAPVNVIATPGDGLVTISWTLSSGATSYNIYFGTTSGNLRAIGTRITGVTSPAVVNNLNNGILYFFVVTAVNSTGESGESTQVSATPELGL